MAHPRESLDGILFVPATYTPRQIVYKHRPTRHGSAAVIQDIVVVKAPPSTQATSPTPTVAEDASGQASVPRKLRGWPIKNRQTTVLYAMASMVFAVGILVSIGGLRANTQVAAQVKQSQKHTDQSVSGKVVPSTQKPSQAAIKNYAVSPNLPRYLDIPKLQIHTRVLSEGVTKQGELQVPWNIYDTGWYNASAQPGQNGAMLVDGHSGLGNTHGIFYKLASLVSGDPVTVTRGDGQTFTYKVVKVQTVNVKDVDMASMLVSADTNRPGLNLITCAGDQIPGTTELTKRVLVYAVM